MHVALGGRPDRRHRPARRRRSWPPGSRRVLGASSVVVTRTRKGEERDRRHPGRILDLQLLGPVGPDPSHGVWLEAELACRPRTLRPRRCWSPWTPVWRSARCAGRINGFCATAPGGSRWRRPRPARRTRRTLWSVRHEKGTLSCPTLRRPARKSRAGPYPASCRGARGAGPRRTSAPRRPEPGRARRRRSTRPTPARPADGAGQRRPGSAGADAESAGADRTSAQPPAPAPPRSRAAAAAAGPAAAGVAGGRRRRTPASPAAATSAAATPGRGEPGRSRRRPAAGAADRHAG